MRTFNEQWLKAGVAKWLLNQCRFGSFNLSNQDLQTARNMAYLDSCKAVHSQTGSRIIFTRDAGHHASGWWKNPDYDLCLHLSLSFVDPEKPSEPVEQRHDLAAEWIDLLFPATKHLIWTESPYSDHGKRADVWHYRVFYAPGWVAPILPRGEVYTKEFTDAGWLSWSDRAAQLAAEKREEVEK